MRTKKHTAPRRRPARARRGAAGRRAERRANPGGVSHVPDARVPPA